MSIKEIREVKDTLHRLSADEKQRSLYEMRALNKAKKEGREEGLQQGEKIRQ